MSGLGKNFHIIHMSDDFAELDAWYGDVFGVTRYLVNSRSDVLKRDASLVLIGDLCIEPMAPTFDLEGWEHAPLGRFQRRFGKRWHSVAWYMHGPEAVIELYGRMKAANIRVYDVTGRPVETDEPAGLFTHPKDTVTLLEMVGGGGGVDPRFHGSFDPGWWTREHPLHVTKSSHVTLGVRDMDRARRIYLDLLEGQLLHEADMPFTSTHSVFVAVGEDLVIELAEPLDADSAIARDMEQNGESLYSVTLQVADLAAAEAYLRSKGITTAANDGTTIHTDPATTHGAQFGFTTMAIPNDARPAWA